ncbi:MAG: hypothetical protein ABI042_14760 [Verrucomicrobiota bacterium]
MASLSNKSAVVTDAPLQLPGWLSNVPFILIAVGGLGVLIGYFTGKDHGMQLGYSYLLAYMFFLSICLGGLFLVILHHLFDAMWSVSIRRVCEHIAFLLPIMGLLFIPIALLAPQIYPWMSIDPATDHSLHAKHALINTKAFYVVSAIIFAIWTFLSYKLRAWSLEQDKTGAAQCTYAMRFYAAWGVFAFAFTLTMAAIFWMKSLQHQFFSTMYGVYYFAGSVWLTLFTVYVITLVLKKTGPLRDVVGMRQFYDLGAIAFAFTVFYAYIHFSQYFLIWNAAVPEETFWYVLREHGTWWQIGMLLIFGHFLLPFLALLRIDFKMKIAVMGPLCLWAWINHFCDMAFNITPVLQIFRKAKVMGGDLSHNMKSVTPDGFAIHPLDLACMAFIGGVLALVFIKYFKAHAPYPQRDPRFAETMGVYVPSAADNAIAHGGGK